MKRYERGFYLPPEEIEKETTLDIPEKSEELAGSTLLDDVNKGLALALLRNSEDDLFPFITLYSDGTMTISIERKNIGESP